MTMIMLTLMLIFLVILLIGATATGLRAVLDRLDEILYLLSNSNPRYGIPEQPSNSEEEA